MASPNHRRAPFFPFAIVPIMSGTSLHHYPLGAGAGVISGRNKREDRSLLRDWARRRGVGGE